MAPADIPVSFGFSAFIKIFLPGFLSSILFSLAIMPNIASSFWLSLTLNDKLLAWIIFGIIFGMILTSLEMYIYQFYEGIRFWPKKIWKWKYNRILKDFENTKELYKLREYPYDPAKKRRYPREATRLGNVMAEYETYSEVQYGMNMMIFWPHLRYILSKEQREYLDIKGAKVDFLVYVSFIFLIYAPFAGIGLSYQWIDINWDDIQIRNVFVFSIICIIVALISLLISYLFYKISISALNFYGKHVKALFDLYRFELAKKFELEINLIPDKDEIETWKKLGTFLIDYTKT